MSGCAAAVVAIAAYPRGPGAVVLAAGLMSASGLAMARAATAFTAAASPSIVDALEDAGLLGSESPRPRPLVMLTGTLTADAAIAGPGVLLRLAVSHLGLGPCACPLPVDGQILLTVGGGAAPAHALEWRAGRQVRLSASVRRAVSFRNLGAPDAEHDLVRRRLALVATVKSALLVELVARGSWVEEWAARVRARARVAIARAAGDDRQAAAIGTAVLIGIGPGSTRGSRRGCNGPAPST